MPRPVALVTGANRGIGKELATQLGDRGFLVVMSGRDASALEEAAKSVRARGCAVETLVIDVGDLGTIERAFAAFASRNPRLDVLVNNAGVVLDKSDSLLDIEPRDAALTLTINALGPLWLVQTFLPTLTTGSRVINVSSGGGQLSGEVSPWSPMYCVSKTTLNAITLQLAAALKDRGIAVNALCPGWVRTDMGGSIAPRSVAQGADTALWLACEADPEVTGKFFRDRQEIPW